MMITTRHTQILQQIERHQHNTHKQHGCQFVRILKGDSAGLRRYADPDTLGSYEYMYESTYEYINQCCGSGSAWIRNFCLDPAKSERTYK